MTRDVPGEGLFLSALAAFRSRTCYANSGGDHLVPLCPPPPLPVSPSPFPPHAQILSDRLPWLARPLVIRDSHHPDALMW